MDDAPASAPLAACGDTTPVEAAPLTAVNGDIPDSDGYFNSFKNFEAHGLMVGDKPRTEAYRSCSATLASRHPFRDKVVLDIGAGTGILSLFAVGAGRRQAGLRIRGIRLPRPGVAERREERARGGHPGGSRQDRGRDAARAGRRHHLRVDGLLPAARVRAGLVIVGRDRFLAPDGIMFPKVPRLYACPSSLAAFHCDQLQCRSAGRLVGIGGFRYRCFTCGCNTFAILITMA